MPEASRGRAPARDRGESSSLGPLQVRYYKRMRLQHVYSVVVGWAADRERRPPAGAPPVTVRLLMAGAQVVPTEHTLDPADEDAKATFYVTPLAKGFLRNEKLEILVGGRKVQELPLPCKVVSQKMTAVLLLLALLFPGCMLSYCRYSPLQVTERELNEDPSYKLHLTDLEMKKLMDDPINKANPAYRNIHRLRDPEVRDPKTGKFDMNLVNGTWKLNKGKREKVHAIVEPGEVLSNRTANSVPSLPGFLEETFVKDGLIAFRQKVGDGYDKLIDLETKYQLAFYVFVVFVFLALLSFIFHQDRRKKRLSRPIPLPRGRDEGVGTTSRRPERVTADLED